MIPTVGRIVYYKALNNETYPALVTVVNNETNLGLHVFYPTSPSSYLENVEQGDAIGTWNWMPYQKEQAVKQEGVVTNGNESTSTTTNDATTTTTESVSDDTDGTATTSSTESSQQ